jgi:hypothetical protein
MEHPGACPYCEELLQNWSRLVFERRSHDAVDAYWAVLEHRMFCVVCQDEALMKGCFGAYLLIASSLKPQLGQRAV